jgi:F-type H+-transporting ATPase subunit delta
MRRIAKRYSKALFQLANSQNKIDSVYDDLKSIVILLSRSNEFKWMLENPLIQSRIKSNLFTLLFKGKVDPLTYDFLGLICDKKRMDLLPLMILCFEEYVHDFKGILTAEIISAKSIGDDQIQKINEYLSGKLAKTIIIKQSADNTLIGGFIISIKDTVIDLSVKGQLERLREKMILAE